MKTVLAIASFEKGQAFLRQCKAEGCRTLLLTSQSLQDADWPRESLDDIYFMPDTDKEWNLTDMIHAVSFLARTVKIDKIVPLDDFDVEKAALLREHLRIGGMGDTTARYFRDKLAMRSKARESGLAIPRFVGVLNHDNIRAFMADVPPPYVLKPRTQAGAIGIKKVESVDALWPLLETLGDRQSYYLLEEFLPGTIWHVDSIVDDKKVLWALVSRYARPPLEVSHEGRVFCTQNVVYGCAEEKALKKLNATVLKTLGLVRGVSHTEYIQSHADGEFYFLETSARVGGAHIADMIEAASGLNLWAEWAKLETRESYVPEPSHKRYAGLLVSLAKQETPDLSAYEDPEVWWRMQKKNHAGIIVASERFERVSELLTTYTERFYRDFFHSLPPKRKRRTNMNRVFHSWHSPRLNRTMELLEFGHAGMPLLVFPTSLGKYYEYEDRGMVGALTDKIEAGHLHLYCVDSVDAESWYNKKAAPWDRVRRHNEYEGYLLQEVLPLMGGGRIATTGCSFGGYHAVNFALRHPDIVSHCVSMGGAYDLTSFLGDYRGEDFYFHQPLMYLPEDNDGWYWERYQQLSLVLATGESDICRRDNERLSGVLYRRSIPHRLDVWGEGTGHDWFWWQRMARAYF